MHIDKYAITHFLLGALNNNTVDKVFFIYQTGQFLSDRKIFLDTGKIEKGQSIENTFKKFAQYALGRYIGGGVYTNKSNFLALVNGFFLVA